MAISRQVTCINKDDRKSRYEAISHIGGPWGTNGLRVRITQAQAIKDIEDGTYTYYVKVGMATANVIVETHSGNKYLKTERDSTIMDNLLSLPQCL